MIPFKRQLLLLLALFTSAASLTAQQAGDSPVKIFILAGQSNMEGKGLISPVETTGTLEYVVANDPDGDYQFVVDEQGDWVVRDDVWIRDEAPQEGGLTVGYGTTSSLFGPELGFGHLIGDRNEEQVLILKAAWGGKSLAVDFRPPSSGSSDNPSVPYDPPTANGDDGFYYSEILRLVNEAKTNLGTYFPDYDGNGYEIVGFGWHQGWNDRVDPASSAEYETNMANFIRDMRNDLEVADLPFVIATTGMDGTQTYTTVELAQLAMANATAHPDFAGNVAVIDTRATYDGLEFWQSIDESPKNEGYHWNRNAKTYLNIGLAMGDAMSLLAPARCPFRPRAVGEAGGVQLSWQNGTEMPTSVRIVRNGTEIAAAAPTDPASFLDTTAEPGLLHYEFQFTMPGDACDPLLVTLNGGITGMRARPVSGGVELTWTNNMAYDAIEIRRNGVVLEAALDGTATSYTDAPGPDSGVVIYSVAPTHGSSVPATDKINYTLAGELGILNPLLANDGINPATGVAWAVGDTYRLIGTTVDSENAPRADASSDIAVYNQWVNQQAAAHSTVERPWSDATWFVVGSTPTVSARQNTGTDDLSAGAGVPILKFDGLTVIARDNADLWDALIPAPIDISFDGTSLSSTAINTGTYEDGLQAPTGSFGDGDPNGDGKVGIGYTHETDRKWVRGYPLDYRNRHYYAMSEVLTIQDTSSGASYQDWSAGPWEGTLSDSDPELDSDQGGLKAGFEWVLGGDPTLASDDVLVTPNWDNNDPTFFTFTYRISDAARADASTSVIVEYGSNLSTWTQAVDNDNTIEITTSDGTGNDEGFDLVTVQIDRSLEVGGKLFVRLRVFVALP
jgi:hypothetical protein